MASTGHAYTAVLYQSDWFNEVSILHGVTVGPIAILTLYVVLRLLSSRTLAPNDQSELAPIMSVDLPFPTR